ncbi:hypothetical protein [Chitinophaga sancti]|uniref:Uncharacterized protein n=1 Tax=Chitinophaga sancti TaxID=1004 RepID=A0A1K1SZY5_9BACT|nr:hypothetical protein [Chitinophaga sancti]WQD65366.1 hypothetical protein U0033_13275 [Chitinophaga sancti]WQG89010.1 hypothetical protein SR876_29195 [Chitinophaga sancti]SFW89859.1 hypothetical protein SAMN05661012_06512 [Chitinophaga sancti]
MVIRQKTKKRSPTGWVKDRAVTKIAGFILLSQREWANWMNNKTSKMPLQRVRLIAIAMGLLLAAVSVHALYQGITGKHSITGTRLNAMSTPVVIMPRETLTSSDSALRRQISDIDEFLDTLKKTVSGRRHLAKIVQSHPGILDSLKAMKNLYGLK